MIADLKKYDQKYVLIKDIYGETHIGLARYENADFLECEWGGEGDGLFIEDFLIYNDQIASIEAIVVYTDQMIFLSKPVQHRSEIRLVIAGCSRQQKQNFSGSISHLVELHYLSPPLSCSKRGS